MQNYTKQFEDELQSDGEVAKLSKIITTIDMLWQNFLYYINSRIWSKVALFLKVHEFP